MINSLSGRHWWVGGKLKKNRGQFLVYVGDSTWWLSSVKRRNFTPCKRELIVQKREHLRSIYIYLSWYAKVYIAQSDIHVNSSIIDQVLS